MEQLKSNSFRNELARAAISAIRSQRDPSFKDPLMDVLKQSPTEFTSRGLADGLSTLGQICSSMEKKADVRRFLLAYVNDARTTVKTGAIRALGYLGDPRAISVLEAFTSSPRSSVSSAARSAIDQLRKEKPMAPNEVVSLRQDIAKLKSANEKLSDQIESFRKQLDSWKQPSKNEKKSK